MRKGLKWKLEDYIGYRLFSKADCRNLSERINEKLNRTVSVSTIYRLFLHDAHETAPYIHTLDTFAVYIGYNSWFELESHLLSLEDFTHQLGIYRLPTISLKSLLSLNIKHQAFRPLHDFLEQFRTDLSREKKLIIGQELFSSLRSFPTANKDFFKGFSQLPIVRSSLFEVMADPDFTLADYELGLGYYLKDLRPESSNRDLQDFIFANALLIRHYFVSEQHVQCQKIGIKLYQELNYTPEELSGVSLFPQVRYFCYRIYFNELGLGFDDAYWEWLFDFLIKKAQPLDLLGQRIIVHTLCDVLNVNPALQSSVFYRMMDIFPSVFQHVPKAMFQQSIPDCLKYLESNASVFYRMGRY